MSSWAFNDHTWPKDQEGFPSPSLISSRSTSLLGRAERVFSRQVARQGVFISSWEPSQEEDTKIYDEVTEDQYQSIVRGRLQKDDFVVDDGVEGYMDNGMDDWMDGDEEASEGEIRTNKKSTYFRGC